MQPELLATADAEAALAKMPLDDFDWAHSCEVTILDDDTPGEPTF